MDPESRAKTAFSIFFAHLEFTQMPFCLKNAPATFQRLMDYVLSGLQGIELFVYMDDIVVYGTSLEGHARKHRALLGRFKEAGLALQPEKCNFLKKSITYLGHVISRNGVKPDPRKTEAVEFKFKSSAYSGRKTPQSAFRDPRSKRPNEGEEVFLCSEVEPVVEFLFFRSQHKS